LRAELCFFDFDNDYDCNALNRSIAAILADHERIVAGPHLRKNPAGSFLLDLG
jgi:hypothetical protein